MRLPLLLALLGLLAFCGHASSPGGSESNLTYFGAPRFSIEGVVPVFEIGESYIRSQTDGSAKAIGFHGEGGCSASNPCVLGSCCNSDGQCGYRSEHCSPSSPNMCVADCDAKAPCGEFSADGKTNCPLNACCSRLGFCGTSDVFCRDTASATGDSSCSGGNCGDIQPPSCGKGSGSASRRVAYYQSWYILPWNTRRRPCDKVWPSQLDTTGLTHIVLSFATIDPKTFQVGLMNRDDEDIYKQFMALPDNISKWIGIGGFEFSDPGATRTTFSDMVSSKENRKAFIDSLQQFVGKWKFSGVDIDWEWPGHESRGGRSWDGANQVELLKEMRQFFGNNFGLGVVIPAQYEYSKDMDIKGLEAQVDWLTILSYDLHGAWDATVPGLGSKIKPHTDLKEIDDAMKVLWSSNIESKKINMGVVNYGRGYTVADKNCAYYGCDFTGPSKAGSCTQQDGVLSICEIERLIKEKNAHVGVIAGGAEAKEATWDDQWVSYDDSETLAKKLELANDRCLGGTALWAIDYGTCPSFGGSPPSTPGSSVAPSASASAPASSAASSGSAAPSPWPPAPSDSPAQSGSPAPPSGSPAPSSGSAAPSGSSAPSSGSPAPSSGSAVTSSWVPPASSDSAAPSSWAPAPSSGSPAPSSWSATPSGSPAPSSGSPVTSSGLAASSSWVPAPSDSTAPPSSQAGTSGQASSTGQSGSSQAGSSVLASSTWQATSTPPSSQGSSASWSSASGGSSTPNQPSSAPGSSTTSPSAGSSSGPASSGQWTGSIQSPSSSNAASSGQWSSSPASSGAASSGRWTQPPASSGQSTQPPPSSGAASSSAASSGQSNQPPGSTDATSSGQWTQPPASSGASTQPPGSSGDASSGQWWTQPPASSGASTQPPGSSGGAASSGQSTQPPASSGAASSGAASSGQSTQPPATSGGNTSSGQTGQPTESSGGTTSGIPGSTTNGGSESRQPTGSSNGPTSGTPSTTNAPLGTTNVPSGTTSSALSSTMPRHWCPDECKILPWCNFWCSKDDLELDNLMPPECWWFDWCLLWWGFPTIKHKDGEDGRKCKLLGCGCGWMGLPHGPGGSCKGGDLHWPLIIELVIDLIGLFPDPCHFFGCNGRCGVLGCDGWCFGEEGCIKCPDWLCKHGGPKIGPRPSDAPPLKPPGPPGPGGKPKGCEAKDYTTATDLMVICNENVFLSSTVSATTISFSSLASTTATTATSTSSACETPVSYVMFGCNIEVHQTTTTVSKTSSNSLSSSTPGPACTRAPLSLDDDEGNNIPEDWDSSSSIFASNTTVASTASSTSKSSSTSLSTTSTSASAKPSPGPMDKKGIWMVTFYTWIHDKQSRFEYVLYDPNGNWAGQQKMETPHEGTDDIYMYIETNHDRAEEHKMLFGVKAWFTNPTDVEKARVEMEIQKSIPNCDKMKGVPCNPKMVTETKSEDKAFYVDSCYQYCSKDRPGDQILKPEDLNCQDLNDSNWEWHEKDKAWVREFNCNWKGF